MSDTIIRIENVTKQYRLGAIGARTLRADLQSRFARMRKADDPNRKLDVDAYSGKETFLALDNVSFEVKKGEAVGIIGHNGAGKSTLLKLLSRVTAPTSGTISYNGTIATMLEVGTGFHPELTGRENVYMNGAILGMTKKEIDKKMDSIIEFAEMERFIDTPVKRYSSGMYVKLAFSVAAHLDSDIMIMDEVLAVGDMKFQQKCLGKMGETAAQDGKTILYVSHNMNTIRQLCTRCIVLNKGKLCFDGDVEKAIAIYSDMEMEQRTYYDYSQVKRPIHKCQKLKMLDLTILREEDQTIHAGDRIPMILRCKTNKAFDNMMLRFEVMASDNTCAGIMFLDTPFSAEADQELSLKLEMDTSHLAPGQYRCYILAYEQNEFGMSEWDDRVEEGLLFKVDKKPKDIEWLPQYWGHTKFHDIKLVE